MSGKKLKDISGPLFSIILPVYQNQETLTQCVDSVLRQRAQNYELILVDDGSTDESGSICDGYAARYPQRIAVIHKRNEGPLLARIEGIRRAQGDYLLFLDADDTYVPGMLCKLEETVKRQKADIVIFNYYRCYSNGKSELNQPFYRDGQAFEGKEKRRLYEELIVGFQLNALWQKCIRREMLAGLEEYRQFGRMLIGEDKLLSMEAIDRAERIVCLAEGLYNYRIAQNSISHRLSLKHYQDMDLVYRRTFAYMEHWEMDAYKERCCLSKAESGLSCLYAAAGEVWKKKKSFADFEELALYIIADEAYWHAFALCEGRLSFPGRAICSFLRKGRIKTVFWLLYMDHRRKRIFRKDRT